MLKDTLFYKGTLLAKGDDFVRSICFYETSIGRIGIAENGKAITDLWFADKADLSGVNPDKVNLQQAEMDETPLLKKAAAQLTEYLDGTRREFDLPLAIEGTEFQTAVWKALLAIPYGETRSYGDIAQFIGNSKACRAVGMTNNRNRIAIIVPCHRVIGANGKLVGYGGGMDLKERLLALEKWKRG